MIMSNYESVKSCLTEIVIVVVMNSDVVSLKNALSVGDDAVKFIDVTLTYVLMTW